MVRTQIQLTEEQAARLKAAAARRGISMAELIRQGIEAFLSGSGERPPEEKYRRAAQLAGKFRSGKHDVAERHDDYLAGEYAR